MDPAEAVAAVCRLGLQLDANTERICPECGGIMLLRADPFGLATWMCRRCGHASPS